MKVIDIHAELSALTPLDARNAQTTEAEADAAFANLGAFRDGAVFTGSFTGDSPWEKHPADEMVQVVKGQTEITILSGDNEQTFNLVAGTLIVVPASCWHRFHAPAGVSLLTITPQPTEHCVQDPRT